MTIILGKENHLLITQPKNQNKKAPCAVPKFKMNWQVGRGKIRGIITSYNFFWRKPVRFSWSKRDVFCVLCKHYYYSCNVHAQFYIGWINMKKQQKTVTEKIINIENLAFLSCWQGQWKLTLQWCFCECWISPMEENKNWWKLLPLPNWREVWFTVIS